MTTDQEAIPASVLSKLNRAREHVQGLAKEAATYHESLRVRRVLENEGKDHVFLWESYSPAPERLGLIIGDAVHNVRSSLDHLVVTLAKAGAAANGGSVSADDERGLQYPIFNIDTTFDARKGRYLKHVSERDIVYIRARQPFTIAADPSIHFLARISDLDNADKHRQINVPVMLRRDLMTDWPAGLRCTVLTPEQGAEPAVGGEVCRFKFSTPQEPLDVQITPTFAIMLPGNGSLQPAEYVLTTFIDNVQSLIQDIVSGATVHGSLILGPAASAGLSQSSN